ncbi:hypothetical protein ACHAWF_014013 [Thalassiosira exigua]
MSYRWDDIRSDQLEVEWGENLHNNRTRRVRTLGCGAKRTNWLSTVVVLTSTLATLGILSLVALTLVKPPITKRVENSSNAEEMGSLVVVEIPTPAPTFEPSVQPTSEPTNEPSSHPTSRPTIQPTIADSLMPSQMHSVRPSLATSSNPTESPPPSTAPSGIFKVAPAPEPKQFCIDQQGFFHNHAGDKVSCDWLLTVGTYNVEKNCENTDIGKACLFKCRDYNNCIMQTDSPSQVPSAFPSTVFPSANPTLVPPKSVTLLASADATIRETVSNANIGTSTLLKVDGATLPQDLAPGSTDSGAYHILLRFDWSEYNSARAMESASLRLKAANSCPAGGYIQRTNSPHWDELTVTWDTAPDGDGTEIGQLGATRSGFWYTVDVTSTLQRGHDLSMRLYPLSTTSNECLFVSREDASGGGPELHVVYADG